MPKNLASRVFQYIPLRLTLTERQILAYLLGYLLDESLQGCDRSQTEIAKGLIRKYGLDTTPEAYRRTVNTYLTRLVAAGLITKVSGGAGRVARLEAGPVLTEAIAGAKGIETLPTCCPHCGHGIGHNGATLHRTPTAVSVTSAPSLAPPLAGHGQVSMHGTMIQVPELSHPSAAPIDEKDNLIEEIMTLRRELSVRKVLRAVRNEAAYRRTLTAESTDTLRSSRAALQSQIADSDRRRTYPTNPPPPVKPTPADTGVCGTIDEDLLAAEAIEAAGESAAEQLPLETLQQMITEELTQEMSGSQARTWRNMPHQARLDQARYLVVMRLGRAAFEMGEMGRQGPPKKAGYLMTTSPVTGGAQQHV